MNTKETPPPKSSRRFSNFSSIDFSCLPKSSMSTPLNSKTNGIPNRVKPPQVFALTPKVANQIPTDGNIISETELADENPDQSVLEALDVSYKDWKVTWSEESWKPSEKKRKFDWSVEDEAIIEKLNETRKKFCSRILPRPFETIDECSMEEYQEEELINQNEVSEIGSDESSVQIIDEKSDQKTLVDEDCEVDETMIAQGKIKPKFSKEDIRHGGSTIVLDDTEDKHGNSKNETSIEDGEIVDTIVEESVEIIDISKLAKDKVEPERNLGASASPLYIPKRTKVHHDRLRPIVIDGSNVAFAHGKSEPAPKNRSNVSEFSCWGIKLVVEYFVKRGHDNIVAFVPEFRKKSGKSCDGHLLDKLEKEGHLAFTPSREVNGRFIASHDDRFILGYAAVRGGVVVTRDNFKDHYHVREWRDTIANRLLQPTFFRGELIQFPEDPMGRNGVSLNQFLKFENVKIK